MHHSKNEVETEDSKEIVRRQRIGLFLMFLFSTVYFGFIFLCTFSNAWFAQSRLLGVPATVWYGFSLIALALIIAGVYGSLCRRKE
jgi:uncharacterized membrane protein (DUF485 family)